MNFQIRAIHLYNQAGARRTLPFRLNHVNIITGKSATGKSSTIDIVDYCLGSSGYPVAAGVIRQTVSLYAVELATRDGNIMVARAAPSGRHKSNSQMHVSYRSVSLPPPTAEELTPNADVKSAIGFLSRNLGIDENVVDTGSGRRNEFDVTIRHALFFCIQAQDEIANQNLLFHSQGEEYRPQAIRDVLPYFLGVIDPIYLVKRERLRSLERELRELERQENDDLSLSQSPGRASALVFEAVALGLIQESSELTRESALAALSRALESDLDSHLPIDPTDELTVLLSRREELRSAFSQAKAEQRRLRKLRKYEDDFNGEAGERHSRLQSLGLLKIEEVEDTTACPVCSSPLADPITSVTDIREQLERVNREIADVSQQQGSVQIATIVVEQRLAELSGELAGNQREIDQVAESADLYESIRDISLQRAAARGRISLFLSSVSLGNELAFLSGRIEELRRQVDELRVELDPDLVADRLSAALSRISYRITEIATNLQLEHAPAPVRLDTRALTIVVDTVQGSYRLQEIGSAANWLGYHLASLMGLHSYLIENDRPVPRFLLLDQPSQVYFPPDYAGDDSLRDEDHASLDLIFESLFKFVEDYEEEGGFQILITEHADLDDSRFENAIVERWRADGDALIPQSWINEANARGGS
jgi:hypothetical protein